MFDPVWNKRIEESDRALDPLGMNRVNDRFLNDLLPGITTVTPRARYYSFYVWAINQVGKVAQNLAEFKNKFYDLERLYMLSCLGHEQFKGRDRSHTNINGSDKGRRKWTESDEIIPLNFRYFGNRLGGYGQYYQGAIARLGLTAISEDSVFEQPTETGLEVANAFDYVAKRSGFKDLIHKKSVTKEELKKCGSKICLCRLKNKDANDLKALQNVFFDLKNSLGYAVDSFRQQTLCLIMFCSNVAANHNFMLSDQHFLDACYYGQMRENKTVFSVDLPEVFTEAVARWKIFRAHDYLAYSAEAILHQFLEFIAEEPSGGTFDDFIDRLAIPEALKVIKKLTKATLNNADFSKTSIKDMLDSISKAQGLSAFTDNEIELSKEFDKRVLLTSNYCEYNSIKMMENYFDEKTPQLEATLASWIPLLLSIYIRFLWVAKTKQKSWLWLTRHTNDARGLSPATFTAHLEVLIKQDISLVTFMRWFVENYVVEQAKRVYEEKSLSFQYKPRCWFHKEEDRYVKDREYEPRHRNARFESAVNILEDLGMIRVEESTLELTENCHKLLAILEEV